VAPTSSPPATATSLSLHPQQGETSRHNNHRTTPPHRARVVFDRQFTHMTEREHTSSRVIHHSLVAIEHLISRSSLHDCTIPSTTIRRYDKPQLGRPRRVRLKRPTIATTTGATSRLPPRLPPRHSSQDRIPLSPSNPQSIGRHLRQAGG
jgi:hypothetical protein